MDNALVALPLVLLAATVKLSVPVKLHGVPEIVPVPAPMLSPTGKEPALIEKAGVGQLVTAMVWGL
jgi:hypothetical protein